MAEIKKKRKSALKHLMDFGKLKLYFTDEEYEQFHVAEWLRYRHITNSKVWKEPITFIHVPNEGKVSFLHGFKINQLGRSKGFPDLQIFSLPKILIDMNCKGLAVEMKSLTGKPSEDQIQWLKTLDALGWHCYIFNGHKEAIKKLEEIGY